jgi:hypothetical protein
MSMDNESSQRWVWSRLKNGQPGQAGDLANNFRNEGSDLDPGVFARDPIPNTARFLAREFIQNTVDASRDPVFTSAHGESAVEVVFRFVELRGAEKSAFIDMAGLSELASRRESVSEDAAVRSPNTCLATLDDDEPVRLLFAEEHGASGMYGPWDDELGTSKMSIALLSGNVSDKPDDAGGSFGHGKSVNAMASRVRLNFAYTRFPEDDAEPLVERRLLGVAYWPEHKRQNRRYWGFGLQGQQSKEDEDVVVPWVNPEADDLAERLGFTSRAGDSRDSFGTSLLIVDPDVKPDDLLRAVERYWWPAISDARLRVTVVGYEGTPSPARPKRDPLLKDFEASYRAIKTPSGHSDDNIRVRPTRVVQSLGVRSGDIGMSRAPVLSDDALIERQTSVVAYVRGLGMVVKYRSLAIGPTFVNGVFVANDEHAIERLLVKAEPKTHYNWLANPDGVEPAEQEQIRLLVHNIDNSVRDFVREYSKSLTPPDNSPTMTFKELDRELSSLIRGRGFVDPPESKVRDFSIHRGKPTRTAVGADKLQVKGTVRIARTDERITKCKVAIKYYLPDDANRGRPLHLHVQAPPGFTESEQDPSILVGPINDATLEFDWTTPPYDRDWEGDLDVEVTPGGS